VKLVVTKKISETLPGVRTEKLEPGRNGVRRVGFLWFLQKKVSIEVKFKVPFYFLKRLSGVLMSVVGL